ncbi:MAG: asparagine synthase (glutamine-hydrolyzing) [Candidatus Rokuibacteriota bacterium]
MCGIAGQVAWGGQAEARLVQTMIDALRHRGPDDQGVWADGPAALGSRRLAVIDLSSRARQPMANEDGSLHAVLNGEIYNYRALRADLEGRGHRFRSDSDTEVVVHGYEDAGVECLRTFRGMFALALWDTSRRTLLLARDRLGKKPLFYAPTGDGLRFASEVQAILQDPAIPRVPDLAALGQYLTWGCVAAPRSAFQGIQKLPPAHYLLAREGEVRTRCYWSLRYAPKREEPEAVLAEEFLARLEDAVRIRLRSDVPLGALLSGGMDSSSIVALIRRCVPGRLQTFSIGFEQPDYDELAYARAVAARFETEHHELVVKPAVVEVLPRLVWHYGEPFADASAVPTFQLCAMARETVTVALGGDGGDEALGGYDRYLAVRLAGLLDRLPHPFRQVVARGAALLPEGTAKSRVRRLRRFAGALALAPPQRYARWMSLTNETAWAELCTPAFAVAAGGSDSIRLLEDACALSDAPTFVETVMHADVRRYLPDDLLVKMDIASMAHGLEVRSPFLDHPLVEFTASLPLSLKLRGTSGKYLLRRVMGGILPDAVLRRPKMGFGVPVDRWLRHDLREMARDLLLDTRARQRGYFRPETVARWLEEHAAGRGDHHARLWSLLMLELWHRTAIDRRPAAEPPADGSPSPRPGMP